VTIDTGTSGFPGPPADRSPIPAGTSGGRPARDAPEAVAAAPEDDTGPPAIGDHALIGNCRTAALVSRDGGLDWLCLPHFSGEAVFCALLDRQHGGTFSISPIDRFRTRRRYRDDTAVLETTFETARGTAVLTDAMPVRDDPESTLLPETEIVRRLSVVSGEMDVSVRFAPRPSYGRRLPRLWPCGTLGWSVDHRGQNLFFRSEAALACTATGDALEARLRLAAGETVRFSLASVTSEAAVILPLGAPLDARIDEAEEWWRRWSGRCRFEGRHAPLVRRSAVTLKMLAYALSGAVIAAPTTSLPEAIRGSRNWDYRYCWLRDASLTLEAFVSLGYGGEAATFLEWLLHSTRLSRPRLKVLYDVYGQTDIPETELTHLAGYRDSRPVRIGNAAAAQFQLDAYGQMIVAAANFARRGGELGMRDRQLLVNLGKAICELWHQPDNGIWEIRGGRRHWTHSKMMCWAGLDCLLFLEDEGLLSTPHERFEKARDEIAEMLEKRCRDPRRGYGALADDGTPAAKAPDCSLLLMPRYGYLKADDPRMVRTVETICRELGRGDGLLLRYPPDFDGMDGEEHPFGICSFWAVETLARQDRLLEAEDRFDRLAGFANDLGLYGEEIAEDGTVIGNFPQAFTHVGLILAAQQIEAARQRAAGRRTEGRRS